MGQIEELSDPEKVGVNRVERDFEPLSSFVRIDGTNRSPDDLEDPCVQTISSSLTWPRVSLDYGKVNFGIFKNY